MDENWGYHYFRKPPNGVTDGNGIIWPWQKYSLTHWGIIWYNLALANAWYTEYTVKVEEPTVPTRCLCKNASH